jgi:hypothetical protein
VVLAAAGAVALPADTKCGLEMPSVCNEAIDKGDRTVIVVLLGPQGAARVRLHILGPTAPHEQDLRWPQNFRLLWHPPSLLYRIDV